MINWARVTSRNVRPSPSILLVQTFHKEYIHAVQRIVGHQLTATSAHVLEVLNGFLQGCGSSSRLKQRIVKYFTHTHRRVLVHKLESDSTYSTLRILTSTYLYLGGIYYASQLTL
jgi:hypothetical protein